MPYGQSPWMEASDAFSGTAQNMNHVALAMAQMKYRQALADQRQALALGRLALQGDVDKSLIGMHEASANRSKAAADIDTTRLSSANDLSDAVRRLYPVDMSQGPTKAGAMQMTLGDIAAASERLRGLKGNPVDPFGMHNIGPNQVAVNPMTGELRGQGPTAVNLGQMVTMPGGMPQLNPRIAFAPAGSTPMTQTGQPLGPQTGFAPGKNLTDIPMDRKMAALQSIISAAGRNFESPTNNILYDPLVSNVMRKLTNAPAVTNAPMSAPADDELIEVTNPNGKRVRIRKSQAQDALQQGYTQ
jgi:hypothetical protein